MNEPNLPPHGEALDIHLGLLRMSMTSEEYELLLGMVEPVLRALDSEDAGPDGPDLDDEPAADISQAVRDEAALVIATAVTGRVDNELIQIEIEGGEPVRVVTDPDTAADPERRKDIADCIRARYREDEELRGIAEASGIPTDL
ncbi:hypothetical protein ACH40E_02020 [Streptomyces acidicola]|uniref:Uncharacterized protein n=1 Tax=Streptomyces acidicola TaxID=2596892 RepID=A0A5N8WZR5_9ACTN|nr:MULTISPECIES: hypothetical protein [Streptomyces]MBA2813187.1 hypothetical protein [Streptomyces sp. KM273126]MPY52827.1 hypothetical protein [Streptomyces acidicola]